MRVAASPTKRIRRCSRSSTPLKKSTTSPSNSKYSSSGRRLQHVLVITTTGEEIMKNWSSLIVITIEKTDRHNNNRNPQGNQLRKSELTVRSRRLASSCQSVVYWTSARLPSQTTSILQTLCQVQLRPSKDKKCSCLRSTQNITIVSINHQKH